jgi:hypothetical protein
VVVEVVVKMRFDPGMVVLFRGGLYPFLERFEKSVSDWLSEIVLAR